MRFFSEKKLRFLCFSSARPKTSRNFLQVSLEHEKIRLGVYRPQSWYIDIHSYRSYPAISVFSGFHWRTDLEPRRTRTADLLPLRSLHRHETHVQSWCEAGRRKLSVLVLVWRWFWSTTTWWTSRRSSQSPVNGRRTAEHSTSTCTNCLLRH